MERWVEKHLRWLVIAPALIVLVFLIVTPTIYLFVVAVRDGMRPCAHCPWREPSC